MGAPGPLSAAGVRSCVTDSECVVVESAQDFGQHFPVLSQHFPVLSLCRLDCGQRLGVLVDRLVDVEHCVVDGADSVVLLVKTMGESSDFRASHAEQGIT